MSTVAERLHYQRALRARRKAAHLCTRCGAPAVGGVLCAVHAAENRRHVRLCRPVKTYIRVL
jgi:hypothetical protein